MVRLWLMAKRAMPKSITLTSPFSVTMIFCGLTSRWTMPFSWAHCRAVSTSPAILAAVRPGTGFLRSMYSFRVMPLTYSITR